MPKFYRSKRFWSVVGIAATIAFNAISGNKVSTGAKAAVSAVINTIVNQVGE